MRKRTWAVAGCAGTLAGTGALGFLGVALAWWGVRQIDPAEYQALLVDQVNAETGRTLTIDQTAQLSLGLRPRLQVDGLHLANADWATEPTMLHIAHLEAELMLLPLLVGEVRITRVVVEGAELRLERSPEGEGNWAFLFELTPGGGPLPAVHEVVLRDAALTWVDGGSPVQARAHELRLGSGAATAPLSVQGEVEALDVRVRVEGTAGTVQGLIDGSPLDLDLALELPGVQATAMGSIGQPHALADLALDVSARGAQVAELQPLLAKVGVHQSVPALGPYRAAAHVSGTATQPVLSGISASLGAEGGLHGTASGRIDDPLNLAGMALDVTAQVPSTAALAPLVGPLPALPPMAFTGHATGSAARIALSNMVVSVGADTLRGTAAVNTRTLAVETTLTAARLDVDAWFPGAPTADAQAAPDGRMIPAVALPAVPALPGPVDLQLAADTVIVGGETLSGLELHARLDDTGARVSHLSAGWKGASVRGIGRVSPGGAVALRGTVSGVDAGAELSARQVSSQLSGGTMTVRADLRGTGRDTRALAASLTGSLYVDVGPGTIDSALVDLAGADLLGELGSVLRVGGAREERGKTPLECAVLRFTLADGVATSDRGIAVQTQDMVVVASGTLNLADESLDFGARPRARGGSRLSAGALASAVRVKGTMSAPRPELAPDGALDEASRMGNNALVGARGLLSTGRLDTALKDPTPCDTVRSGAPAGEPLATADGERQGLDLGVDVDLGLGLGEGNVAAQLGVAGGSLTQAGQGVVAAGGQALGDLGQGAQELGRGVGDLGKGVNDLGKGLGDLGKGLRVGSGRRGSTPRTATARAGAEAGAGTEAEAEAPVPGAERAPVDGEAETLPADGEETSE